MSVRVEQCASVRFFPTNTLTLTHTLTHSHTHQCVAKPLVWAKVRGYPLWPAKVWNEDKKKGLMLSFFGTHDLTWVPPLRTRPYEDNEAGIPDLLRTSKHDKFKTALEEVQKYAQNIRSLFGQVRVCLCVCVFVCVGLPLCFPLCFLSLTHTRTHTHALAHSHT